MSNVRTAAEVWLSGLFVFCIDNLGHDFLLQTTAPAHVVVLFIQTQNTFSQNPSGAAKAVSVYEYKAACMPSFLMSLSVLVQEHTGIDDITDT